MPVDTLLSRLKKVKRTSKNSWLACCSSHQDRSPSLTVKENPDGRILIHCFAGCSAMDVLGAVGLDMQDLFNDTLYHKAKPIPGTKFYPRDVLESLKTELMIVAITALDLRKGKPLSEVDQKRLDLARERIITGMEYAGVE